MSALVAASTTWLRVGRVDDVPYLEGRSVHIGERRVAIFRLPDGWAAIDHACPHKAGPLADGMVADQCVTCPLHGQRFSLLTGERQDADGVGVRTYEVRERDGYLELCLEA
ncbi:MAG: nitrite reductase small subunit NirD [Solirubrobacterales bacterium]|nr:nitrite reductase small subunit NirD [Solirubrobacterales bacterium]